MVDYCDLNTFDDYSKFQYVLYCRLISLTHVSKIYYIVKIHFEFGIDYLYYFYLYSVVCYQDSNVIFLDYLFFLYPKYLYYS